MRKRHTSSSCPDLQLLSLHFKLSKQKRALFPIVTGSGQLPESEKRVRAILLERDGLHVFLLPSLKAANESP